MQICNYKECTGCEMCANICPRGAVEMKRDEQGFYQPVVKEDLCVNCGICSQRCPQNNDAIFYDEGKFYAAVSKNDAVRKESSSGGVFSDIAEYVLGKKGVVFGAVFNEDFCVEHQFREGIGGSSVFRGSKYVQSRIRDTYKCAKKMLDSDRLVLFSGTPCQIAGLKAFLGKEYEKLITLDILCHGVPSPGVFKEYLENEEKKNTGKVRSFSFRNKETGWKRFSTKIEFKEGEEKIARMDDFIQGFLQNYYLRKSCYHCRYTSTKRVSDLTLGDYWGYQESAPEYIEDDDLGISLILVNSEKGEKVLKNVRKRVVLEKRTAEDAVEGNPVLKQPSKKAPRYEEFWEDKKVLGWKEISEKYFIEPKPVKDYRDKEAREYYSKPFMRRHRIHKLRKIIHRYRDTLKK